MRVAPSTHSRSGIYANGYAVRLPRHPDQSRRQSKGLLQRLPWCPLPSSPASLKLHQAPL